VLREAGVLTAGLSRGVALFVAVVVCGALHGGTEVPHPGALRPRGRAAARVVGVREGVLAELLALAPPVVPP